MRNNKEHHFSGQVAAVIKKELVAEWRQKYALNGVLLQVVSMIFVVFVSIKIVNAPTWNAIYWIILLFSSVNAIGKGFIAESRGLNLYYYSIASAQAVIVSKLIYNALFMMLIIGISFITYSILMDNVAQNLLFYSLTILLGGLGFSFIFTMISAIATKAGNSNTLLSILSFPVIIPLILVSIKASKKAMDDLDVTLIYPDLLVMLALNAMIIVLALLLFPFLWRD